jgi:hypothetical protein
VFLRHKQGRGTQKNTQYNRSYFQHRILGMTLTEGRLVTNTFDSCTQVTLEERKIGAAWMFENAAPDHSKKVFFALRQTLADFRARIVDRDRVAKVTPHAEPESSVHLQIVEQAHETRLDYGSVVRLSQFVSERGPSPFGRGTARNAG